MAKQCIFCSRSVDSAEHLFSEWILKELKPTEPFRFTKTKAAEQWINKPEVRITCVCHKCNSTWMSDLETQNKPHMLPMLRDFPITLEPLQQKSLARWAILKSMVLEAANRQRVPFYSDGERHNLKPPSSFLPIGTSVWIGRFSKGKGFHAGGTDIFRPAGNMPKAIRGVVTTIIMGYFVIQVLTIHVLPMLVGGVTDIAQNPGKWDVNLLTIWPVFGAVRWPPPVSFTTDFPDHIGWLLFRWKIGDDVGT